MNKPLLLSIDNLTDQMWGGQWIRLFKGLPPANGPVGESWELSAHQEHPSTVEVSPGVSVPLPEIIKSDAQAVLGARVAQQHDGRLPLLTKFIDAADDLSVQVHPDDTQMPNDQWGKSEAWMILDVQPMEGSEFIYLGFDPAKAESYATQDEFAEAFFAALNQVNSMGPSADPAVRERAERVVLPFLNKVRVRAGDVFAVPPGTVHAIGRGVRLFEIQQASDVTYRLWDWNRPDEKERAKGRNVFRTLHIDEARPVIDFGAKAVVALISAPSKGSEQELVREKGGRFVLSKIELGSTTDRFTLRTGGVFQALTVIKGTAIVGNVRVQCGRTVLIPAAMMEVELHAENAPTSVLRSTVPV